MKKLDFKEIFDRYNPEQIIETLAPFLTDNRKLRISETLQSRIHSIHVAMENPADIHNALAIVRSGEALGISNMHIIREKPKNHRSARTCRGGYRWTDLRYHPTFENFKDDMRQKGFLLAGACLTNEMTLEELPVDKPLCLLFGNEHRGLSEEALQSCDFHYTIPMHGMLESLNLSVSAAISLYETLKRKRDLLNASGDLSREELLKEQARYYINAAKPRVSQTILKL
ncbi:MAG: tRNA (guanosine-2'-O-)-methyltransferase [Chlamydiales bacterium]|jgi:tRNA (guanosine-2'-O-)-methyltransferase